MDPVVAFLSVCLIVALAVYAAHLLAKREPVLPAHYVTIYVTDGGRWSWRCRCGETGETTSELAQVMGKAHLREAKHELV